MPTLVIKTVSGAIFKLRCPMHFMVMEHYNLAFDDIEDVGSITEGKVVWYNRKPQ